MAWQTGSVIRMLQLRSHTTHHAHASIEDRRSNINIHPTNTFIQVRSLPDIMSTGNHVHRERRTGES
jgi:hypothetical protein